MVKNSILEEVIWYRNPIQTLYKFLTALLSRQDRDKAYSQ